MQYININTGGKKLGK